LLVVVLDNRSGYGSSGSASNEGTTTRKMQSHANDKKDLHVVAFWVMTVLPVGIVAFMPLGAKLL
jgi:hypothetical protein